MELSLMMAGRRLELTNHAPDLDSAKGKTGGNEFGTRLGKKDPEIKIGLG